LEKKKKVINLFFRQVYRIFRIFLTIEQFLIENDLSRLTTKLKQKETILKLGNPLKSKSKFTKSKIGLGASTSTPYQGFTLNPNPSDSRRQR
jgi:hypothetical protein